MKKVKMLGIAFAVLGIALITIGIHFKWFSQLQRKFSSAEKTLIVCVTSDTAGFDIAQYADFESFMPSGPLFNRLVSFGEGNVALQPSLAKSWTVSQDGLTYTFHLRRGVPFHTTDYFKPTRDFNADDVVFTFERMRNPKHPFNVAYPAEFPLFVSAGMNTLIQKIIKIDDHTVQFILHQPHNAFLGKLAKEFASILSAEYANQLLHQGKAEQINQKPIGTGPFILKNHVKNQKIHYVANRFYWDHRQDGMVKLQNLIFAIHGDPAMHNKKLLAGECHMSFALSDMKTFKQNKQLVLHTQPGVDMWYVAYNTQKPILSKRLVRQALDMALNKIELIKPFQGMASVAINMMPPAQWPYDHSLKNAPYNPIKAKALLKAAGYPNGFHLKFFVNLASRSTNKLVAQMIQADWKKIGVTVEFVSYETGEFWRRVDQGDHDVVFAAWNGLDGDPDNWFVNLLSCKSAKGGMGNHARWCYKPFDDLLAQANHTRDPQQSAKRYIQAQKLFKQEVPFSPLFHTLNMVPYHQSVKFERSFIAPTINLEQFTGITIK